MISLEKFVQDCLLVKEKSPLVHNITNYVAMNVSANALLAVGASPLMSFCPEEMDELVFAADAVVINIGCLDSVQIEAMRLAAAAALRYGRPLVLDPVGAGASSLRLATCQELIREYHPSIIRANASEVAALAYGIGSGKARGVDSSIDSKNALDAAKDLARSSKSIVSMSGPVDYITDGERVETICNGSPLMPKVTAMGCSASAITGAFAAVDGNFFDAAIGAMALMGLCGDKAAEEASGTGSFACRFVDALSTFGPVRECGKIKQL